MATREEYISIGARATKAARHIDDVLMDIYEWIVDHEDDDYEVTLDDSLLYRTSEFQRLQAARDDLHRLAGQCASVAVGMPRTFEPGLLIPPGVEVADFLKSLNLLDVPDRGADEVPYDQEKDEPEPEKYYSCGCSHDGDPED